MDFSFALTFMKQGKKYVRKKDMVDGVAIYVTVKDNHFVDHQGRHYMPSVEDVLADDWREVKV